MPRLFGTELDNQTSLYGRTPAYLKPLSFIGNTITAESNSTVRNNTTAVTEFAEKLKQDLTEFKVVQNNVIGTAKITEPWKVNCRLSRYYPVGNWLLYARAPFTFTPDPKVKPGLPEQEPSTPDTMLQ